MPKRKQDSSKIESLDLIPPAKDAAKFSDPMEILALLRDAILNKPFDKDEVSGVLRQVLSGYEAKNRVFLIAAANAEVPRIIRLLSFINGCESELFKEKRLTSASNKDLLRLYALAQSNLLTGLDSVKKVADMRLEMSGPNAPDSEGGMDGLFSDDKDQVSTLSDLPGLDAQERDKVRKIVGSLVEAIREDDSVSEEDEHTQTDSDD